MTGELTVTVRRYEGGSLGDVAAYHDGTLHVGGLLGVVPICGSHGAIAAGGSSWRLDEDDLGSRARHSVMTGERIGPHRYQCGSVVESTHLWGRGRGCHGVKGSCRLLQATHAP